MSKFTPEQRLVIRTKERHAEVLAYAGTGKTKTLCGRIHWLFRQGITSDRILVLSFSNNAVDILDERLEGRVQVRTFHAFAMGLVRQHHRALGLATNPGLIIPSQQLELIGKAIKKSSKARMGVRRAIGASLNDKRERQRLAAFYTRMQGDWTLAKSLAADPGSGFHDYRKALKPLKRIHRRYCEQKLRAGVIDYSDMLRLGRQVLEQGGDLPAYQYLFVDECQDMNREQAALLRVLAAWIPHVMVFGDPFQGVFGFAGGRYWQLSSLMDGVRTYSLTQSFRLTQRTADCASAIAAPLSDEPVRLIGIKPGRKPRFMHCETSDEQTRRVVKTIRTLVCNGASAAGIAILARTKAMLRDVEIGLLDAGFPIRQRHRQAAPEHVDKVLDILRLIEKCAARMAKGKKTGHRKLEQRLLDAAGLGDASINPKVVAESRRKLCRAILSPTLEGRYIAARKIYEKLLRAQKNLTENIRAELGRWEPLCARFPCAADLQEYIGALHERAPVTTSTIHAAKGAEWDHVLVLHVTDGAVPFYREIERGDVEEERRLCYVAVSRARERVFLFHAPYHHAMSGRKYEEPSRFLTREVFRLLNRA